MLTIAQLAPLKDRDPYLYETLAKVVSAVNATSQRRESIRALRHLRLR